MSYTLCRYLYEKSILLHRSRFAARTTSVPLPFLRGGRRKQTVRTDAISILCTDIRYFRRGDHWSPIFSTDAIPVRTAYNGVHCTPLQTKFHICAQVSNLSVGATIGRQFLAQMQYPCEPHIMACSARPYKRDLASVHRYPISP